MKAAACLNTSPCQGEGRERVIIQRLLPRFRNLRKGPSLRRAKKRAVLPLTGGEI